MGGRVQQGPGLGVRAVLQDGRQVLAAAVDELALRDDDRDPARADVLLGAGVDHRERRRVDRARQEVARHVADLRRGAEARQLEVLHAVDGLVARPVHVRRRRIELGLVGARGAPVAALLGGRRDARPRAGDRRPRARFGVRLRAPGAVGDVVRRAAGRQEAHRHERELQRRAALQEEDVVGGRRAEQLPQQRERLVVHGLVLLSAMGLLHHGHAGAGEVEQLVASPLEGGERQGRGARVEVHRATHGGGL